MADPNKQDDDTEKDLVNTEMPAGDDEVEDETEADYEPEFDDIEDDESDVD